MSIFDGISNVRKPEVTMNSGPLPTAGPPYFPGVRINYAADLLGDHVDAYSYGSADHVSNQTSYLNIAHRIQKIVPQLNLPNASSEGTFQLSHAVDIGDIGFVLRIDRRGTVVPNIGAFDRLQLSRMVDPLVNLVTVNYLLAGLQRFWNRRDAANWQQLMVDLRFVEDAYAERSTFTVADALRFVRDTGTARPFGVPHTSELQGGQHEGGSGPVTYPVNFISTFFVSGLTRNICNIWSQHNISAGDDLILKLEKLPISARDGSIKYHLNHWKKSVAIQQFRYEDGGVNEAWQLVPAVLSTYAPGRMPEGYDHREHGHWHICRSQLMFRNESLDDRRYSDAPCSGVYHDDRVSLRGALIEATFEPVWVEYAPWEQKRGVKRGGMGDGGGSGGGGSGGGGSGGGGSGGGGSGGGGSGGGGSGGGGGSDWSSVTDRMDDGMSGDKSRKGLRRRPRFTGGGRLGGGTQAEAGPDPLAEDVDDDSGDESDTKKAATDAAAEAGRASARAVAAATTARTAADAAAAAATEAAAVADDAAKAAAATTARTAADAAAAAATEAAAAADAAKAAAAKATPDATAKAAADAVAEAAVAAAAAAKAFADAAAKSVAGIDGISGPIVGPGKAASEAPFSLPPQAKKQRRVLGLAVGLGSGGSTVMVHSVKPE